MSILDQLDHILKFGIVRARLYFRIMTEKRVMIAPKAGEIARRETLRRSFYSTSHFLPTLDFVRECDVFVPRRHQTVHRWSSRASPQFLRERDIVQSAVMWSCRSRIGPAGLGSIRIHPATQSRRLLERKRPPRSMIPSRITTVHISAGLHEAKLFRSRFSGGSLRPLVNVDVICAIGVPDKRCVPSFEALASPLVVHGVQCSSCVLYRRDWDVFLHLREAKRNKLAPVDALPSPYVLPRRGRSPGASGLYLHAGHCQVKVQGSETIKFQLQTDEGWGQRFESCVPFL